MRGHPGVHSQYSARALCAAALVIACVCGADGCSGGVEAGAGLQQPTLVATTLDAHSVKLEWTAVAAAATYDLRRSTTCPMTGAGFDAASRIPTGAPQPAGTAEVVTATDLTSDVSYCFVLAVSDGAGHSKSSNNASATTRDDRPPAAPVLTVASTLTTSIAVGWAATGDDESTGTATSQELRYLSGSACPIAPSNFSAGTLVPTRAPAPSGTPVSAAAYGLSESTTYCFLLEVTDKAANTVFSNVLTASTADATAPAVPVLAVDTAFPPSETQIRLTWTDVGDDGMAGTVTRQTLRYWSADFCTSEPADAAAIDVPVAGPAGTADGVTLTGLQRKTGYCFVLIAYDDGPNSARGAVLRVRTQDLTPPASPALSFDGLTPTSVTLHWTDVGDDGNTGIAQAYMVHASTGADCATFSAGNLGPIRWATNPAGAAGTPDGLDLTGLAQGTDYCIALRVIDAADNAAVSNVVTFHTPLLPPGSVSDLRVAVLSSTKIDLRFTESGRYGAEGTVPAYDVRYSTGADCDAPDWYDGAQAQPVPFDVPLVPSGPRELRLGFVTLDTSAPLCFALQSVDGAVRSALSNIARPPARIADLTVTAHDDAAADFSWTAVGAHDFTGTAARYEMVLQAAHGGGCPGEEFFGIEQNIGSVYDLENVPAPLSAGNAQTAHVPAQTPGHAWCAALRTVNADGSASVSNVVGVVNPDSVPPNPPGLALAPASPTAHAIPLLITASGDDGADGAAEEYDVIVVNGCSDPAAYTEIGANSNSLALALPCPPSGTTFQFNAFALSPATDYCLAAYALDTLGNRSARSNVVVGATAAQ